MPKQKILIYSDCYIYGGSEKLMAFLLQNTILIENFILQYAYRNHREYEIGLINEMLLGRKGNYPLLLFSNETIFYKINTCELPSFAKMILKAPFFIIEKIGVYFLWNLIVLIYLLFKLKPDIIHVNNGGYPGAKSCNILVVANYLTNRSKVIYQVNNQAIESKGYFEKIYDKFIHKNVNYFINASFKAKQQLFENRNFDYDKILVINNCVPLPKVKFSREQLCKELNIPEDSFLIVEVAFLTERKGQRYLIDALAELFEKHLLSREKVFCALVGNGEDETFLKKRINKMGLNSNVFLLGYRNNSEDYISASDLFVLPSIKDEDMPLVLLSALGYGKAIIATDFAGISQVIDSNVNGVLINNNLDTITGDLANEIIRLYNYKKIRSELGCNAKKTYHKYGTEIYGLKLKQIYEQVYASQ